MELNRFIPSFFGDLLVYVGVKGKCTILVTGILLVIIEGLYIGLCPLVAILSLSER